MRDLHRFTPSGMRMMKKISSFFLAAIFSFSLCSEPEKNTVDAGQFISFHMNKIYGPQWQQMLPQDEEKAAVLALAHLFRSQDQQILRKENSEEDWSDIGKGALLGMLAGLYGGFKLSESGDDYWESSKHSSEKTHMKACFSPDSKFIALASKQEIILASTGAHSTKTSLHLDGEYEFTDVQFSNDGNFILATTKDSYHAWTLSGTLVFSRYNSDKFRHIVYCQDYQGATEVASTDGTFTEYIGKERQVKLHHKDDQCCRLLQSPNRKFLVSLGKKSATIFDAKNGTPLQTYRSKPWRLLLKRCQGLLR